MPDIGNDARFTRGFSPDRYADPQRTLSHWSEGKSKHRDIVVTPSAGEDLTFTIDRLQSEVQFVVIGVQGSANQEMVEAMSRADLVLIPMQAKTADADVATRAISLLRSQENLFKRQIPHAIVFMRTSPIPLARIDTRLHEREGKSLTNLSQTLSPEQSEMAVQVSATSTTSTF